MTVDIDSYLLTPYKDGGRERGALDCWGLALCVREDMGLPPLPSVGAYNRSTPVGMAKGFIEVTSQMQEGSPRPGALAAVFKGRSFVHVGVVISVDGKLAVLETNPAGGARWLYLKRFMQQYFKVIFYCDKNLPEQA